LNYQLLPNWNVCSILASNGFWHSSASISRSQISYRGQVRNVNARIVPCPKIIIINIYMFRKESREQRWSRQYISMVSPTAAHKTSTQWMPRFDFNFDLDCGDGQMSSESGVLRFECIFIWKLIAWLTVRKPQSAGDQRIRKSGNSYEIGTITYRESGDNTKDKLFPWVLIGFDKKKGMRSLGTRSLRDLKVPMRNELLNPSLFIQ